MFGAVEMPGGVFVPGGVATANLAADEAHAEMNPGIAKLDAFFTDMFVGLPYFDLIEVRALFGHRFLRRFCK
jgi:hypothetical protein